MKRSFIGGGAWLIGLCMACASRHTMPAAAARTLQSGSGRSSDITAEDLHARLYVYADDSMMGREAWSAGNEKATAYLAEQARAIGLEPAGDNGTYFQEVPYLQNRRNSTTPLVPARNVIAIVRGTDPVLRNEYIAIGAHSDHLGLMQPATPNHDSLRVALRIADSLRALPLGQRTTIVVNADSLRVLRPARRDSIYNGADDDGSGTVALLEIAQAFAHAHVRPKRSILFVWHTAEEKGLIGSAYFTDHPTVPRDSIVAQLNVDMIGRGDANTLYVVGTRLSTELGDIVDSVNAHQTPPLTLDYSLDAKGHRERVYCRSDHYMYARYGIPIAFFTTGLHSDYHQVTDEAQYIDYAKLERVTRLVYGVAQEIANGRHAPVVDHARPDLKERCRQ